jgi:hypothetical protein
MKFHAPNEKYSGVTAGVVFDHGVGDTDDPAAIEYLTEAGYKAKADGDSAKSLGSMNKATLLELVAAEEVADVTEDNTKAEIVAAIEAGYKAKADGDSA